MPPVVGGAVTFVDAGGIERAASVTIVTESTNVYATLSLRVVGESGERHNVRHKTTARQAVVDGSYWY